ncbi:MAG: hypothetical protein AB7E37_00260 [Candidatus Altimarinota bacterium]
MLQKYQNEKIIQEIQEKGFCVYDYISYKELFLTVKKDYLNILMMIYVPLSILLIISGLISVIFFIIVTIGAYFLLFLYLFSKLLQRSYYFVLTSQIVYTKSGIIIGKNIYKENIDTLARKLENIFHEPLGGESKLDQIISQDRNLLIEKTSAMRKKIFHFASQISSGEKGKDGAPILIVVALVVEGLVYVFYYLGYFLGIAFFYFFYLFIKVIVNYKKGLELKIKDTVVLLDKSFQTMNTSYLALEQKIHTFKEGEIGNLNNIVEKNFTLFYDNINNSLHFKKKLFHLLEKSSFKDFIDFPVLELYIKKNFNKPVEKMIELLQNTKKNIEIQIGEIDTTLQNTSLEKNALGTLEQKKITLNHQYDLVVSYMKKFENTLL